MPQVISDLFKFSEYSDRKKFTILIVGMVIYFGWINSGNVEIARKSDLEKYNTLRELYNEERAKNKDLSKENKALLIENGSFYKNGTPRLDSINIDLKIIKDKLKIK